MGLFCVKKWQKCQCLKAIHLPHNSGLAHRFHLMTPEAFCLIKPLYHHYHGQQTRFMLLSVYSKCLSAFSTKAYFSDALPDAILRIVIKQSLKPITQNTKQYMPSIFSNSQFQNPFPKQRYGLQNVFSCRDRILRSSCEQVSPPLCLADTSEPAGLLPSSVFLSRLDNMHTACK